MRLLITSNAEWVVPAMFGERRFAIFDVGSAHKEDHPYFNAIQQQMVPATSALLDQQMASMTPEQAWWLDVLRGGQLPRAINFDTPHAIRNACFTSEVYDSYLQHSRHQRVSRRQIETRIGIFLRKMVGPNLTWHRVDNPSRDPAYVFPPLKDCRDRFARMMRNDNLEWDDREDWGHSAGGLSDFARRF
jgi:hypothetical protein